MKHEDYFDRPRPSGKKNAFFFGVTAMIVMFVGVLLAAFFLRSTAAHASLPRVDNAIVFLVDISNSMEKDERALARESHAAAVTAPEVLNAIRAGREGRIAIAYVEYGSTAEIIFSWRIISNIAEAGSFAADLRAYANEQRSLGTSTFISRGLDSAIVLFDELPFEATYRTVDVAGDGKDTPERLAIPRQALLDMGVTINGLALTRSPWNEDILEYFNTELIGGPRAFSMSLEDIREMPMAMRDKMILELF